MAKKPAKAKKAAKKRLPKRRVKKIKTRPAKAKKISKAKMKKARPRPKPARVRKETFEPAYARPSEFKRQLIAPPEEKIDVPAHALVSRHERRRQIPHAATALIGAAAATAAVAFVLLTLLQITAIFAAGISAAIFVGSAILFHDMLLKRG